jgi:hypothetical protein
MRDSYLHGPPKERRDGRLELPAGEELECRAVGAVVDENADELVLSFRVAPAQAARGWPLG